MRLGMINFVLPFLFVLNPTLILTASRCRSCTT